MLKLLYRRNFGTLPTTPIDIPVSAQTDRLIVGVDTSVKKASWDSAGTICQRYLSPTGWVESTPVNIKLGAPQSIDVVPMGNYQIRFRPRSWLRDVDISISQDVAVIEPHMHDVVDVEGLQTALDGKASTVHAHSIADVSELQTALDGKASTVHAHSISDVSGLQTALDGKASSNHFHDTRFAAPDGFYYVGAGSTASSTLGSNINLFLLEINSPITMSSIGVNCAGNQVGVFTLGLYRINAWSDSVRLWQSPSLTPVDLAWIDTPCNLSLNSGLYWLAITSSVQINLWAGPAVFTKLGRMAVSTTPATGYVLSGQAYSGTLPQNINITAPVGGSTWALTNQRIPVIRYR